MYVNNLVLEVTRRCNLKCGHCMRGSAQCVDMSNQVLFKTFYQISSVGCLTITGGEPFMKPEIIENIFQEIMRQGVRVDYFYIVTNAASTRNRIRVLEALHRLYQWCEEPEMCVLTYSGDQYHRYVRGEPKLNHFDGYLVEEFGERYWKDVEFFDGSKGDDIREPINEGRAAQTQVGRREPEKQVPWDVSMYDGEMNLQGDSEMVIIAANGNIGSCCNMSFKRFDAEARGNILTDSLEEVVRGFCVMEQEEQAA